MTDQNPAEGVKNLTQTFKKNPTSVLQLKNMTPSWNVGKFSLLIQVLVVVLLSACLNLNENISWRLSGTSVGHTLLLLLLLLFEIS